MTDETNKAGARPATSDVPDVWSVIAEIDAILSQHLDGRDEVEVLEAGCGSSTYFTLGSNVKLTGIDISPVQLERNDDLDEKICGDLQDHALPEQAYDVVICWYVLEHLPRPEEAMRNMARALRSGGLLIFAVPSVLSIKGLITKWTPHWFHVAVYRRLLGRQDAGEPDRPPFPTHLRWSLRPSGARRAAARLGLEVECHRAFEDYTQGQLRGRHFLIRLVFRLARLVGRVLTFGRWNAYLTDFAMICRKRPLPDAASDRRLDAAAAPL